MEKNTAQTKEQALELMHEAHKVLLREMDRICSQNHLLFLWKAAPCLGLSVIKMRFHGTMIWTPSCSAAITKGSAV